MFSKIATSASKPELQSLYSEKQLPVMQMLADSWLSGGVKKSAYSRPAPYAEGSIIPGSNYSAQDNHDSLKVSGM